jgi:cytoskeletal protein CcmA (bactofilin family)
MALFGKDRERSERDRSLGTDNIVPTTGPVPGEAEMFERDKQRTEAEQGGTGGHNAFLGQGSRVTGKLVFEGPARIEGHVEGEITAQDTLTIGESAVVNAQITGTAVIIHGRVTGDVTARKRLEVRAPAKLFGNISTPSLVIHEGVVFEGHCVMGGTDGQRADKTADKDRKVTPFLKEERPPDLAALKGHVEIAK